MSCIVMLRSMFYVATEQEGLQRMAGTACLSGFEHTSQDRPSPASIAIAQHSLLALHANTRPHLHGTGELARHARQPLEGCGSRLQVHSPLWRKPLPLGTAVTSSMRRTQAAGGHVLAAAMLVAACPSVHMQHTGTAPCACAYACHAVANQESASWWTQMRLTQRLNKMFQLGTS